MNRDNLKKLADYLVSGKTRMEFDMSNYCLSGHSRISKPEHHDCGTVGCAIGHGPAAGIPVIDRDNTWFWYADRVFQCDMDEWDWCFSQDWLFVDNTPQGAAYRIYYMLDHGVPDDAYEQRISAKDYVFKDHVKEWEAAQS